MKLSSAVSVGITTFIGGATGYLTTAFASGIPAGFAWKATAISAALAGISALAHLYQDPTAVPAVTVGESQKKAALDDLAKKGPSVGSLELTSEYPVVITKKEESK